MEHENLPNDVLEDAEPPWCRAPIQGPLGEKCMVSLFLSRMRTHAHRAVAFPFLKDGGGSKYRDLYLAKWGQSAQLGMVGLDDAVLQSK